MNFRNQSDDGLEYCNKEFDEFLKNSEVLRLSAPYTPQQNGTAEIKKQDIG